MCQEISEDHHPAPVGVAAKDVEAAQHPPGAIAETSEEAVAAQEKILPKGARESGRPKRFGLHHCDRDEAQFAWRIEEETGRKERLQNFPGQRVGQDERMAKEGSNGDRVPLETLANRGAHLAAVAGVLSDRTQTA
jgi:hypothetical protein